MLNWIKRHKTWTFLFLLSISHITWLGYTNLWKPVAVLEDIKSQAGETVDFGKDLIEFVAQKEILDLIKVITPILLPIITWKVKSRMDANVKHTTNKVVRDKLGIADRRKRKVKITNDKRQTKGKGYEGK